ncbi:MAG: GntR family transcriptional regulator [Acidobacteria bacterium]|jgi:DNA-binding transcriptional regulator YhcF (GntR family)|nr:GntR family transcriptional regulator [Acidobacteriota bacterium]
MDFVLNRKGGVPLHDQLLAQLELKILGGGIAPGERLPSVRALARQLGLHANTVSAAYRELEAAGHVELKRGAGVFVRAGKPASLEEARGLDEMIRLAVGTALRKGYSGAEITATVERWLRAAPAERVVVVDPRVETIDLVVHEVREALGVPVSGCTLENLAAEPALLSGALGLVFPYHAGKVARLVPGAALVVIHVGLTREDRERIVALPAGATVLLVSRSPLVLSFAAAVIGGLRGDEVLVETRLLGRRAEWRRLLPAADLVLVDVLARAAVQAARPKRLSEVRLLNKTTLGRVRRGLSAVVPRD